jgi:hypothetical protein
MACGVSGMRLRANGPLLSNVLAVLLGRGSSILSGEYRASQLAISGERFCSLEIRH